MKRIHQPVMVKMIGGRIPENVRALNGAKFADVWFELAGCVRVDEHHLRAVSHHQLAGLFLINDQLSAARDRRDEQGGCYKADGFHHRMLLPRALITLTGINAF